MGMHGNAGMAAVDDPPEGGSAEGSKDQISGLGDGWLPT
jgi:hypothetical protein